jgi:hypothetical protein
MLPLANRLPQSDEIRHGVINGRWRSSLQGQYPLENASHHLSSLVKGSQLHSHDSADEGIVAFKSNNSQAKP